MPRGTSMVLDYILSGFTTEFLKLAQKDEQLKEGIKVEEEHKETINQVINDTKSGKVKPLKEYFKSVAKDHIIKEKMPNYYLPWLKAMEGLAKKD